MQECSPYATLCHTNSPGRVSRFVAVPGQKGAVKKEDREDYIFKKLTDTKLYTGASRQRFDSKGVGIGAEGRGGKVFSSFKGNTNEKSDDVGPMDACDFLNRKWS